MNLIRYLKRLIDKFDTLTRNILLPEKDHFSGEAVRYLLKNESLMNNRSQYAYQIDLSAGSRSCGRIKELQIQRRDVKIRERFPYIERKGSGQSVQV